jgi:hypothetical protein
VARNGTDPDAASAGRPSDIRSGKTMAYLSVW